MINELDNDFIKAHINDFILSTLISGEKYGYEIANAIRKRTNNKFELKQPTMYAALQRLEKNGFIRSIWKDSDIGGKRHYYFLSEKGVNELNKNRQIWSKSLGLVNEFFGSPNFASEDTAKQNDEIVSAINGLKQTLMNSTKNLNDNGSLPAENDSTFLQNDSEQLSLEHLQNNYEANNVNLNNTDNVNKIDDEKQTTSVNEIYNNTTSSQSTFLDELKDYKFKYSENLELFTDAMTRLRTGKNYKDDAIKIQDENTISYVSNSETMKNEENIISTKNNENEFSLFNLLEKNENTISDNKVFEKNEKNYTQIETEKSSSDALFLDPSVVAVDKNIKEDKKNNFEEKEETNNVNDAMFISNVDSQSLHVDQAEFEKRQLENTFKSNDFNLEINYVSTPLKLDEIAKKAIIDENQFAKNILEKKYVISNSVKWANIKIYSNFYNVNKLNFISLLLLIPYIGLSFLATYLIAYFTKTVSQHLFSSYYICLALYLVIFIYFAFKVYTCPNKKIEISAVKNKSNLIYSIIISLLLIAVTLAIFNFNSSTSLTINSLAYLWINPSLLILGIVLFILFKNLLIKNLSKFNN